MEDNKVKYLLPQSFYDDNHEKIEAYLNKQNIKYSLKQSKAKKTAGLWTLEIPDQDEKRFELRTRLLKIKITPFKQPAGEKKVADDTSAK